MTPLPRLLTLLLTCAALAAGALVVAGCGDDEGGGSDDGTAGATGTATTGTGAGAGARPQSGGDRPEQAPRAPGGLVVGIGEHGPAMFDDPRFRELGIKHARLVVAYDAARVEFERDTVDTWLAAAKRAGVEPFITFGHSRVNPKKLPSQEEFRMRFTEFRQRWPQVRVYAAWNEANHASQPTADHPEAAADFYDVVREGCRGCTVVAGDLLDEGDLREYLADYRAALDSEPTVWGLHNYSDTNRFRTTGLRRMLAATEGDLWLTETGGIYQFGRSFPPDARRQARATRYTLRLARDHPRVRRVYLYNWTGAPPDARFDAGLVGPDGQERPALAEVRKALER